MPLWGKWRREIDIYQSDYRVHQPEEGTMKLDGQPVQFKSTRDSQEAGIVCIYQHSTAYPDLSVTENIFGA